MSTRLAKYVDPARWAGRFRREVNRWRARSLRTMAEEQFARLDGIPLGGNGPRAIVADGLWDNPNHWFRLCLFVKALPETREGHLIGILRSRADRAQRRTLEILGFREFVYIDEHQIRSRDFVEKAVQLLTDVHSHDDILRLELPNGLPAYVYHDTVLKLARHPQPALDHGLWETTLAEVLRNLAIYEDLFASHDIAHVVLSHPWKNEYATLVWTALRQGIPSYHLTGFCEGIRVRRFVQEQDFYTPVEHLSHAEFTKLPDLAQERVAAEGERYLAERESGQSSDINVRSAYRVSRRIANRSTARRALAGATDRPIGLIYSHVWCDFPHTFAMRHYTDFLDWMQFTLERIREIDTVIWVLKPHPTESWYGDYYLRDVACDLPPHVHLAPEKSDSLTAIRAADAVITVHGTVALEAVAQGVPVICADRSYFSDWGFTHEAHSRDEYAALLENINNLPAPTEEQRRRAIACAAFALAPVAEAMGHIRLRCDSSGPVLYEDILDYLNGSPAALETEVDAMRDWLLSGHPSYAVYTRLRCYDGA